MNFINPRWMTAGAVFYYVTGTLYNISKLIIVLGVGGMVVGFFSTPQLVVPIGFIFVIVGAGLWRRVIQRQQNSYNPGLRVISIDELYTIRFISNETEYVQFKKIKLKCIQRGADTYKHKFRWTGQGRIEASTTAPDSRVEIGEDKYSPFMVCRVRFDRPLEKGQEKEIDYTLRLTDVTQEVKPFLSQGIVFPIQQLVMRVKFEGIESRRLINCARRIFPSGSADLPVWEEKITTSSQDRDLLWKVDSPVFGWWYRLVWELAPAQEEARSDVKDNIVL